MSAPVQTNPIWVNPALLEVTFVPNGYTVVVDSTDVTGQCTAVLSVDDPDTGGVVVMHDGEPMFVSESLPDVLGALTYLRDKIVVELARQKEVAGGN